MTHPEIGILQGHLDGELSRDASSAVTHHLSGCADCRARQDELRVLAGSVRSTLARLDPLAVPDVDRARWEVRRRKRERAREGRKSRVAVAASVLLLVGASAASALPGSPLRGWWEQLRRAERTPAPAAAALGVDAPLAVETPEVAIAQAGTIGVGVPAVGGRVEILLEEVPEGAFVEIGRVDAERAFVEAPSGAEFSVEAASGRARVRVGARSGTLRISVPRDVDGRVFANGSMLFPATGAAAGAAERAPDGSEWLRLPVPPRAP